MGTFDQITLSPASGGATNENYFLSTRHQALFLRHGGDAQAIEEEALLTQIASDIGLAPAVITFDPIQCVLATERIESAQAINLKEERDRQEVCADR